MPLAEAEPTSAAPKVPIPQRPVRRAVSRKQKAIAEDGSLTAMTTTMTTTTTTTTTQPGTVINKAVFLRKFTENALLQVREGNHEEYSKLVKMFLYSQRETSLSPEQYVQDVTPWISAVSANVSALGISYRELVGAILYSDWIAAPDDNFVHRYSTLVLELVSAHPAWVPQAMTSLVRWFIYGAQASEVALAPAVHDRLHALLEQVYRAIPTCGANMTAAIIDAYPFRTAKANVQVLFLQNILRTLDYAIGLRREVLRTVLNRIIQVDVEVQIEVEDLGSADDESDNDDTVPEFGTAEEEGIFEFEEDEADQPAPVDSDSEEEEEGDVDNDDDDDDDDDSSDSGSDISNTSKLGKIQFSAKRVAAKLDAIMSTLFTWLEQHSQPDELTQEMPESTGQLFMVFLDLFGSVVLPTFKSRYTQFFVFYLSSKSPQFSDLFLGTMMGSIGDPIRSNAPGQAASLTKVAAASYLSSFVSRARFLASNIVRSVIGVLVQWACTYIETQEQLQREAEEESRLRQPHPWTKTYAQAAASFKGGLRSSSNSSPSLAADFERHAVFYAMTQAIIYMFCFRWRDMAEAPGGGAVVESELDNLRWCPEVEGIQRIVFSKLNPLRACSSAIASQFAQVASQTNFMFCFTVLQQNRRLASDSKEPGDGETPSHSNLLRTELETFFPFDPMLLPISRQFIDDIYFQWQDVGEEASSDEEGDINSELNDDVDVVDQMVAMSISPARPLSALHERIFLS
ncbi:DNA independent RNA polymerase I transcription factor [Coemansia sp. RSA 2050]|nr:DNA independent RNA polymerase I transcription factor [Coemansia sp. RSA 2050]KAJ2730929.1 DNA independent RNA polymerase I transcription factor [Coemansia sp. BCRC 34962]